MEHLAEFILSIAQGLQMALGCVLAKGDEDPYTGPSIDACGYAKNGTLDLNNSCI